MQGEFNCVQVYVCEEKVNIEGLVLKSQQISFLCITSVMVASSSIDSNQYSLAKLFDNKIL